MDGLTDDERLALLVALSKQIEPAAKEAKAAAREALLDEYREHGTERRAVMVGGCKVGTVGVSYAKRSPAIRPGMESEAMEWLRPRGYTCEAIDPNWTRAVSAAGEAVFDSQTGEALEWAYLTEHKVTTAQVKGCEPADVAAAFGPRLQGLEVRELTEGGGDGF